MEQVHRKLKPQGPQTSDLGIKKKTFKMTWCNLFMLAFSLGFQLNFFLTSRISSEKIKGSTELVSDCETFTHLSSLMWARLTKCLFKMHLLHLLPSGEDISEPGVSA